MRTHNPQYARSEYHTQLAKMSFDEIFDLTAGVYFHFDNIFDKLSLFCCKGTINDKCYVLVINSMLSIDYAPCACKHAQICYNN